MSFRRPAVGGGPSQDRLAESPSPLILPALLPPPQGMATRSLFEVELSKQRSQRQPSQGQPCQRQY